eukprot:1144115-Pelagomonas_calceolata.AAC.4
MGELSCPRSYSVLFFSQSAAFLHTPALIAFCTGHCFCGAQGAFAVEGSPRDHHFIGWCVLAVPASIFIWWLWIWKQQQFKDRKRSPGEYALCQLVMHWERMQMDRNADIRC